MCRPSKTRGAPEPEVVACAKVNHTRYKQRRGEQESDGTTLNELGPPIFTMAPATDAATQMAMNCAALGRTSGCRRNLQWGRSPGRGG